VIGSRAGTMPVGRWVGEDRTRKLIAAVVAGGGLLILLNRITDGNDSDVAVAVVLLGLGAAFLWSRRNAGRVPPGGGGEADVPPAPSPGPDPAPPATGDAPGDATVVADPTAPPAEAPAAPGAWATVTAPLPPAAWPPSPTTAPLPPVPPVDAGPPPAPWPPKAPKPRRAAKPRSVLVAVTFSLLAIQAGVLVAVGASLVTGLALSVLLVGLALVVGAWMGRARWLIPVGLLLSLALGGAVLLSVPLTGETGNRIYRPATVADVRSPYRLDAGEMILDLSRLDTAGATTEVDATVAVGHLVVTVPAAAAVDFHGQVNAGTLVLFGRSWGGTAVQQEVVVPGPEGGGRLVLDAEVGVGVMEVRRAAA
jgi:hypothetical protein